MKSSIQRVHLWEHLLGSSWILGPSLAQGLGFHNQEEQKKLFLTLKAYPKNPCLHGFAIKSVVDMGLLDITSHICSKCHCCKRVSCPPDGRRCVFENPFFSCKIHCKECFHDGCRTYCCHSLGGVLGVK